MRSQKNTIPVALISAVAVIVIGYVVSLSLWKSGKEPIKFGLVTTLTGRASTGGICQRDGASLAVEQINDNGGINGHQIDLIVRDDKGNIEHALEIDRELIEDGVVAIIGHYLSTLSVAAVPVMNEKNILMISAGTAAAELTGKDDNFFRLTVPTGTRALALADIAYDRQHLRNIVIVFDESNPGLTRPQCDAFTAAFEAKGGKVIKAIGFHPGKEFSAGAIADEIIAAGGDSLYLITNAIHGALLCQHVRMKDPNIVFVPDTWTTAVPDFIRNGGRAIDGVMCVDIHDPDSKHERYVKFKAEFNKRFDRNPTSIDQRAYESVYVLARALAENDDPKSLKQTILKQRVVHAMDGDFEFDDYGDPLRKLYISHIKDGVRITIDTIEPRVSSSLQ